MPVQLTITLFHFFIFIFPLVFIVRILLLSLLQTFVMRVRSLRGGHKRNNY